MKKTAYTILISVLFLLSARNCYAVKDSIYIDPYKDKLILSSYYGARFITLGYGQENSDEMQEYLPNISSEIGVGVAWNWFALGAKIYSFSPNDKYGDTKSYDIQWNWYLSKFQVSLSYQDYSGFYTKDASANNTIIQRPDLNIKLYRVLGQYLFNNKKFSYRSSFLLDEQQLRSAGSLKIGFGVNYTSVTADSTLILGENDNSNLTIEDLQFGPNAGYAYTFVFGKSKKWFATPSITAGLGISVKNNDDKIKLFPSFYPRVGFGYAGNKWTIGISAYFSLGFVSKIQGHRTMLNSGISQITCTYRFPFKLRK